MAVEFVELIRTDRQFQIKVGGITAAVLSGVLLAGKGRKYNGINGIINIIYPLEALKSLPTEIIYLSGL